jgi:hypothetical protein
MMPESSLEVTEADGFGLVVQAPSPIKMAKMVIVSIFLNKVDLLNNRNYQSHVHVS